MGEIYLTRTERRANRAENKVAEILKIANRKASEVKSAKIKHDTAMKLLDDSEKFINDAMTLIGASRPMMENDFDKAAWEHMRKSLVERTKQLRTILEAIRRDS